MNIVFDWSGTLADDHKITWNLTNQVLENFGGVAISFDTYKKEFVIPVDKFYLKYCPDIPINKIDKYFYVQGKHNFRYTTTPFLSNLLIK